MNLETLQRAYILLPDMHMKSFQKYIFEKIGKLSLIFNWIRTEHKAMWMYLKYIWMLHIWCKVENGMLPSGTLSWGVLTSSEISLWITSKINYVRRKKFEFAHLHFFCANTIKNEKGIKQTVCWIRWFFTQF